jgi:histidinol-phosphate aminotransferase
MNTIKPQRGLSGIKPYAPGTPIEEVQREYGLQDVIKLASNENPLGPSPKALTAIREALPHLNFYPDGQSTCLRQAIAAHLGFEMEQVAVANGADGIITQLCLGYLEDESEVVVSRSSFPVYDRFAHTMRATLIKTPLTEEYRLDLEAMARAITDRTKLVFVCNPNNPTGTIVSAGEVDAFVAAVPDHVLVVFDEAYYEYVESDDYPDTLQYIRRGLHNVLTLRTFSKAHGLAGIRLGYAVAVPQILAPLNQVKGVFDVNLLAQVGGIAALEDEAFVEKSVASNRAGLRFLTGEFQRLGLNYVESHANFVLVEVGPRATAIQRQLLERGVIVRPCTAYDLPEHLRVSVGDRAQNTRFIRAFENALLPAAPGS